MSPFLSDSIRVRLPQSWHDLSDAEAWAVIGLMADPKIDTAEVPLRAFFLLNDLEVAGRSRDDRWLVIGRRDVFELTPANAVEVARPLRFLLKAPETPWRPDKFRSWSAVSPALDELTLSDWLTIENFLQRVIASDDYKLLDRLAPILLRLWCMACFSRFNFNPKLTDRERLAMFLWLGSVRSYLRRRFPDFYSDAGGADPSGITPMKLQEVTDAQIRALTKGDITKEREVLSQPMYRALSELNALAREYKELKK